MRTKHKLTQLQDAAQALRQAIQDAVADEDLKSAMTSLTALRVVEQRLSRMSQAHDEELVESVGIYGGPDLLRCRKCGIVLDIDARESADEEESIVLYGRCQQ